jgi:hypothetical protein
VKDAQGQDPATPPDEFQMRGEDRRVRPTPMVSRFFLFGRRRGGRREHERKFVYVDKPGGWIVAGFGAVLVLSLLDAYFTLDLVKRGATEANPVMRAALHLGDRAFVFLKTAVTVVAVGFLCLHKNWPLGRFCLFLALAGYTALTAYHLYARQIVAALAP